jgi:hypothetical protein
VTDIIRRKPSSFEEYWLASKAWERKGLPLGTARALVNAGFLTIDDLHTAHALELAIIPRVGPKSFAIICKLIGQEMDEAPKIRGKRQQLNPTVGYPNRLSRAARQFGPMEKGEPARK